MSGTLRGGKRAAITNKEKYGENFYREIGRKGGSKPNTKPKGFAANPALAKEAGRKGGKISKRGKSTRPYKKRIKVVVPPIVEELPIEEPKKKGFKWLFSKRNKR